MEIGELFLHTLEASAEKVPVADLPILVGPVLRLFLPAGVDTASAHHAGGVRNGGAAEPVRENLIRASRPKPIGHPLGAVVDRELVGAQLHHLPVEALQPEGVPHQTHIVLGGQRAGKKVPVPVQARPGEENMDHLISGAALKPGGENGPGKGRRAVGPQGQLNCCAGGDRPIGGFAPQVSGVKQICMLQAYPSLFIRLSGAGCSPR